MVVAMPCITAAACIMTWETIGATGLPVSPIGLGLCRRQLRA